MTDGELAAVLHKAYERAKSPAWTHTDELPEYAHLDRVRRRWVDTVRDVRNDLESSQREQTAATVLAALLSGVGPELSATVRERYVGAAVRLTDELRAALAKVPR